MGGQYWLVHWLAIVNDDQDKYRLIMIMIRNFYQLEELYQFIIG